MPMAEDRSTFIYAPVILLSFLILHKCIVLALRTKAAIAYGRQCRCIVHCVRMVRRRILGLGVVSVVFVFTTQWLEVRAQISNPFPDTSLSTLEGEAAANLYELGVISGFPDGEFKGALPVNRAQAAKILLNAAGKDIIDLPNNGRFLDVANGQWYTSFVMSAAQYGIINGYPDASFRPDRGINTAEFLKMITLAFDAEKNLSYTYKDVPLNEWFAVYAGLAQRYTLFPLRSAYLAPSAQLSRGDVAVAIYQFLKGKQLLSTSPPPPPPPAASTAPATTSAPPPAPAQPPPPAPVAIPPESTAPPPPPPSFPPPPPPTAPQSNIIEIEADNWSFSPSSITVQQGQSITLRIRGKNGVHGFTVPTLGINQSIAPGQSVDIRFPTNVAGIYDFFCNIPCGSGHGDMRGSIVVNA